MKNSTILNSTILAVIGLGIICTYLYLAATGVMKVGPMFIFSLLIGLSLIAFAIYALKLDGPNAYNRQQVISPIAIAMQFTVYFVSQKILNHTNFKYAFISSVLFVTILSIGSFLYAKLCKAIDK
jgi:hypothetical protein